MFWIGAAPTVPGSAPGSPAPPGRGRASSSTKSCHSHAGIGAHDGACRRRPRATRSTGRRQREHHAVRDRRRTAGCCRRRAPATGAVAEHRVAEQFGQRVGASRTSASIGARAATPKVLRASQRRVLAAMRYATHGLIHAAAGSRGSALPCGGASHRRIRRSAPGRDRPGRCSTAPASRRRPSWSPRRRRERMPPTPIIGIVSGRRVRSVRSTAVDWPISGAPDRPPASLRMRWPSMPMRDRPWCWSRSRRRLAGRVEHARRRHRCPRRTGPARS